MSVPDLDTLWRRALDRWSRSIELARPVPIAEPDGPIAYIDLGTRQTHVNFGRLEQMGVLDHVGCVLAHEVGHHIRYPHTTSEARRMLRFLRELVQEVLWDGTRAKREVGADDWLLNLFFDLLINDELSTELESSFVAIFRAMQGDWGATFAFYVAIFEELWSLEPCTMLTPAQDEMLAAIDPSFRARAAATGEFMRAHPENRPLQLVRFLVALRPFVLADRAQRDKKGEAFEHEVVGAGGPMGAEDVADVMRRRADEEEARRWLREHGGTGKGVPTDGGGGGGDPLVRAKLALEGLAPPDVIALAAYRAEAAKTQLAIPASLEPGEPFVPGPHTAWDLGDDLDGVDWVGSVARAGSRPIPGVTTVARTFLPDDPRPGDREAPWIEIYIDSSGSMPNPVQSYSKLIEAGFILVRAATRAGGRVRVVQYSSESQRVVMKTFTRSAAPAEAALLQYIGGGTDFPWDELVRSTEQWRRVARVRRVIVSDSDFCANFTDPTPPVDSKQAIAAAAKAGGITGLLSLYEDDPRLVAAGMQVVRVWGFDGIGQAARALADALFKQKTATKQAR